TVQWRFTTEHARTTLYRLYPSQSVRQGSSFPMGLHSRGKHLDFRQYPVMVRRPQNPPIGEPPGRIQNHLARANPAWSLGPWEHQNVVNPLRHSRGRRMKGLVAGEPGSRGVYATEGITEARFVGERRHSTRVFQRVEISHDQQWQSAAAAQCLRHLPVLEQGA